MPSRARVLWKVARDPQLRRLEVSFFGFACAEHATWLAILVYAYDRGGLTESGLLAAVQLLPAIVVAPLAAYAGDRFSPQRVLARGYAAQAISMGATAGCMWADRPLLAYGAATVAASCITLSRPTVGVLLPTIAKTPGDLVAANVASGFIEYVGMMVGPLVGGVLLATADAGWVFAISAGAAANGAVAAARMEPVDVAMAGAQVRAREVLAAVRLGLRTLADHTSLRALIALTAIGGLVRGVTDVLMVIFAQQRLGGDGGDAGVLGTAMGVGAVVGAVLAAGLIGRSRMTPDRLGGAALFGGAFLGLGASATLALGAVMFVVLGAGESLLRVTSSVGVQRLAPDAFLARIFGVAEGIQMAAMAAGSLVVASVVELLGVSWAMVAIGGAVLVSMTWTTARFRGAGGDVAPPPAELVDRLLADPVFEHLGATALARLAQRVERVAPAAGSAVITEGERGDRYYLIVDGEVEVTVGGAFTRAMGAGESFGEIALVQDVPRTATVTCRGEVELLAIARDEFLEAVTGHPRSLSVATELARARTDEDRRRRVVP